MAKMLRRNLKRSRRAFTPFGNCSCCAGPTPHGRAAEKRQWRKDHRDDS